MYAPTERPTRREQPAAMRAAEVLPFVPVRCTTGYSSWGEPRYSPSDADPLQGGVRRARRGVPAGTPSVSRFTCAVEPGRGREVGLHRSARVGFGELDVDRERRPRRPVSSRRRLPASRTSSSAARSSASSRRVVAHHDPRPPRCEASAAVPIFALRTAPSTSAATANTARVAVGGGSPERLRVGPRARGGPSPSRHHDHTSSVTNGRNGANSRSSVDERRRAASLAADAARVWPHRAVGAALHQLHVVVAERPRRTARCARGRGRSRSRRRPRWRRRPGRPARPAATGRAAR